MDINYKNKKDVKEEISPLEALDILLHLDDYSRKDYMEYLGKIIEKGLKTK